MHCKVDKIGVDPRLLVPVTLNSDALFSIDIAPGEEGSGCNYHVESTQYLCPTFREERNIISFIESDQWGAWGLGVKSYYMIVLNVFTHFFVKIASQCSSRINLHCVGRARRE